MNTEEILTMYSAGMDPTHDQNQIDRDKFIPVAEWLSQATPGDLSKLDEIVFVMVRDLHYADKPEETEPF